MNVSDRVVLRCQCLCQDYEPREGDYIKSVNAVSPQMFQRVKLAF